MQDRVNGSKLRLEGRDATFERIDRLLLAAESAKEHERCPKARVLARRLLDQLAQPGLELIRPGPREAVDRPLRAAALPVGLARRDEAGLGQALDGVVDRGRL